MMNELVYGIHSVNSILDNSPERILCVFINRNMHKSNLQRLINKMKNIGVCYQECDKKRLDTKVSRSVVHQGIIAVIFRKISMREDELPNFLENRKSELFILVLDKITDPYNLGACLRSADAAGVDLVIATRDGSASLNDTVRKVSSGSAENIPFLRVINLSRTLKLLQRYGIRVMGTVVNSDKIIFNSKLVGSLALVIGSEGNGIRHLIRKNCNELISIPLLGSVESLNVSVATGICLFEALRQRRYQPAVMDVRL